ncbi:PQQ-dependent sugar dehydrogenase [Solitalea sp. MAHUQ-68]|uniref:PQQ-dependent sugar dehydrogenase n=1 Tax=Solitalea agri TaxID=2953739 RepID=A0A9X2JBD1_9SPHI|nr:PQQ-dependent sugar dehydrogenase [Solitalea agri]MCO4292357.1 PQQ-dependent sugar dehydrogenase [Solitalea agri]
MKNLFVSLLIIVACISCKNNNGDESPPPGSDTTFTVNVSTLIKGLDTPWEMTQLTNGRVLVTERPGRIREINNGVLESQPWLDLSSSVDERGESGLLGISADPDFNTNKYVYVAYTYSNEGNFLLKLVRLKENTSGKGEINKVLVDNIRANTSHDGGAVKFGPDKKLYWTVGDAGNTSSAQNLNSLNGKILRLNTDGSIPSDNPDPASYVYSYGHRNPQGLAWQPKTNQLYSTEHGPSGSPTCCRDELNYIEKGKNYGWPNIYGDQTATGMVSPILFSGNDYTWAPGGATFITKGKWKGDLLFTGLRGQSLYRVVLDSKDNRKVLHLYKHFENEYGRLRDVMQMPNGDIWLAVSNKDGRGTPGTDDDRILVVKVE